MSYVRKLTLIRHAKLDESLNGCYIGRLDAPLSEVGKSHAALLAERLSNSGIEALWCSPYLRARQTAGPIADKLALDCRVVDDLKEVDFGRWESMTFAQIRAADPELVAVWATMEDEFSFPDGETLKDFKRRVESVAEEISDNDCNHLALISHGGVIRRLICRLTGWAANDYLKIDIRRGGFATLDLYTEGAVLTGLYND